MQLALPPQESSVTEDHKPAPASLTTTSYGSLDDTAKQDLEKRWNQTLGQLCWDLSGEINPNVPTANKEALDILTPRIQEAIDNLSACYFKNLDLAGNMHPEVRSLLEKIAAHCLQQGYVISIKGSYFTDPSKATDLDLLVDPVSVQFDVKQTEKIITLMMELERILGCPQAKTHFTGKVFQHKIIVGTLEVDLNFLMKPLAAESSTELDKTAEAMISFCAVHWYPDGHAVMLPITARSICTARPALTFLGSIPERSETGYLALLTGLPPNALGYLAKNIMKFEHPHVRLDPFLTWFKEYYINPKNPKRPVEGVHTILTYLLRKELPNRPAQTIQFIIDNQLLNVVYPFDKTKFPYELCMNNFKHYFSSEANYASIQSPMLFLSLFFLGAMMNKSPAEKTELLTQLNQMQVFCNIRLAPVVAVLARLPHDPGHFNIWSSVYKQHGFAGDPLNDHPDNIALMMLLLWHPQAVSTEATVIPSEESDLPDAAIVGKPYNRRDRFFKKSMGIAVGPPEAQQDSAQPHAKPEA